MTYTPLADRLWTTRGGTGLLRFATLAVMGSLLVAASAQITVPMWPVPMTLQTLAVLAIGVAYGARLGAATLGLYALEGAAGLPFFAGAKSGIFDGKLDYLIPASSMGYVVGFVVAAWLVGKLVESGWGSNILKTVMATLLGATVIYVPGLIWLAIWADTTGFVPEAMTATQAALSWGLYPFVIGDVLKAVVAGLAVPMFGMFARGK
jgi:biotin transport system substrate-specific component